jgi:MSHA pilin protein MshD
MCGACNGRRQRGVTLVELVLFIVIVSVALSAVLNLLALSAARAADPLVTRQALAIAESLLDEVLSQPVATTDPDGGADGLGPEGGESRSSATLPFDHVNDYHGLVLNGITTVDGAAVPGLQHYRAAVQVRSDGFNGMAAGFGWLVSVTVTSPDGSTLSLSGFRARTE